MSRHVYCEILARELHLVYRVPFEMNKIDDCLKIGNDRKYFQKFATDSILDEKHRNLLKSRINFISEISIT